MPAHSEVVQTSSGSQALDNFLAEQISACVALEHQLRDSKLPRVARLHPLFVAVVEDAASVRLLLANSRLNQAYIVSRAMLERATNYCFLQLCTDGQYQDFIDYSLNKAGRRFDRSVVADGEVKAHLYLKDGPLKLSPELVAAVAKFTSQRGGEKTRWTTISLSDRAAAIEAKLGRTGLFMSLLAIYSDASEALHGTLYGALFHFGVYDVGSVPNDQASFDRHRYETISALSLFAGGSIDTVLSVLDHAQEPCAAIAAKDSKARFRRAAKEAALMP